MLQENKEEIANAKRRETRAKNKAMKVARAVIGIKTKKEIEQERRTEERLQRLSTCPKCNGKKSHTAQQCMGCFKQEMEVLKAETRARNERKRAEAREIRRKIRENGWFTTFRVYGRTEDLMWHAASAGHPGTGKRR